MMKNNRILRIALVTGFLLLIPLVAMQFSNEVDWDWFDFVVAGILLFGSGLAYELVTRNAGNKAYRVAAGLAVATVLLLVWMNLAVGIIGSENNPVNRLYFGVPVIGFIGTLLARFRPGGMARAMLATALAQALVPVIALLIGRPPLHTAAQVFGVLGVLTLNGFFVLLFAGSAWLFRHSACPPRQPETV